MKYNSIDAMPTSVISFKVEKRFNLNFFVNMMLIKIGSGFIVVFILNIIWAWINGELLLSWEVFPYLIIASFLIEVLKSDIHKPALSIDIDESNRHIKLQYAAFFVIRINKEFDFESLRIKFIDSKSNRINRVLFLNSSNSTICYVDKNEELFTQEDFAQLCMKLESVTISK
jgi:hypothetical protein